MSYAGCLEQVCSCKLRNCNKCLEMPGGYDCEVFNSASNTTYAAADELDPSRYCIDASIVSELAETDG